MGNPRHNDLLKVAKQGLKRFPLQGRPGRQLGPNMAWLDL